MPSSTIGTQVDRLIDILITGYDQYFETVASIAKRARHRFENRDGFVRCAVAFCIALPIETGLLYLGKMVWYVYKSTTVGQYYTEQFANRAAPCKTIINPTAQRKNNDGKSISGFLHR